MTVQELINKLQLLNPNDIVLVEVDHDEIVPLVEDKIEEDLVTKDYRLASEEDLDVKRVVVLRV